MNATVSEDVDRTPDTSGVLSRARALLETSRFAEAGAMLQELLEREIEAAEAAEARYMLAVVYRYQKDYAGALRVLDELLPARRDHGRAYQERGYTLLGLNRPDDAASAFAQAVQLNPALLSSWKALANLNRRAGNDRQADLAMAQAAYLEGMPEPLRAAKDLIHEGKLYKAEQLCRRYLREHPHHIDAMRLLADIGIRLHIYDDAEFLLESCVELDPDDLRARADYLAILNRKGKFEAALAQAEHLIARQPDNPAFKLGMGGALAGVGRLDEAIDWYHRGLARTANKPAAWVMIGHAEKARGRLDHAVEAYRTACRLQPDHGDAYWSLANTKTYRFSDAELAAIEAQEAEPGIRYEDRIHLCFAAGKAHEDRDEFAASFDYYERGNALKRERSGYDPEHTAGLVQAQIDHCTPALFRQRGDAGHDVRGPVFIVGLPRAGSTLLEQVLASHSKIDGTMELHEILGLAQRLRGRAAEPDYPANLHTLEIDYFERFGRKFMDDTAVYRGTAPMFIDKMPNNFLHVGLIRLILPGARVIDARRHPMACCFSAYKQLFGDGHEFSYGLEAAGRYYRDYVRMMRHWDKVLPGFVLRVLHEDVVSDLEGEVRRILAFLDLPFERACLEFHRSGRAVRTPSSEQVRQPIYTDGLDQWRNFAPYLDPLKAALGPELRREYDLG